MRKNNSISSFRGWFDFISARKWLLLCLVVLLAVLVRSVPFTFPGMFDPDSHFHSRLSDEIARTHELISWDALSLQGRVYSYPPLLHILTGFLASVFDVESMLVLKVLGVCVGGLFVLTTFLLARLLTHSFSIAAWAGFFAGLSNVAVFRTAAHTRPDGIALMLIPFLLYLWLTRREKLAFVLSLCLVLLHPLSAVLYAILLSSWFAAGILKRVSFPFLLPVALVGMLIVFFAWVYTIGLPLSEYGSKLVFEASEIAPLAVVSFVLFFPMSWVFALVGIWKGKFPELLSIWLVVSIGLGALAARFSMYFIPFFSILAALGMSWVFTKLVSDKRTFPVFAILFLVLGSISIYSMMDGMRPYVKSSEYPALDFLRAQGKPGDAILSSWDQGHVLAYYTRKPVVMDGYFEFGHELERRNESWKNAMSSSACSSILNSIDSFNARYLYLSRDELTASYFKTGLLELQNCPGLALVFASDSSRVYERVRSST
jgi:hypothetical protein